MGGVQMKKIILTTFTFFILISTLFGCKSDTSKYITKAKLYTLETTENVRNLQLSTSEQLLFAVVDIQNSSDSNWNEISLYSNGITLSSDKNEYDPYKKYENDAITEFLDNSGYNDPSTLEEILAKESITLIIPFKVNKNDLNENTHFELSIDCNKTYVSANFNYSDAKIIKILDEILIDYSGKDYQTVQSIPKRIELYSYIMKMIQLSYTNINIENAYNIASNDGKTGKEMLQQTKTIWNSVKSKGYSITQGDNSNYVSYPILPKFDVEIVKKNNEKIGNTISHLETNIDKLVNYTENASTLYDESVQMIVELNSYYKNQHIERT